MNAIRILACTISATLLLSACGPAPEGDETGDVAAPAALESTSNEIIGGATDGGDPAVVLIYNHTVGYLCTGTVIAPRVVLSAGHCSTTSETCTAGTCQAAPASQYDIVGGTNLQTQGGADWVAGVTAVHPHPQADLSQLTHDMSIFILDQDAPVTPLAWQKDVDDTKYAVNTPFKAVGYGITDAAAQTDTSGIKRTVGLKIVQTATDAFAYGSSTKNTCSGDSGGPAIATIAGVETVIGTVSYGDQNCTQYGVDMRTDYNGAFIATYDPDPSGIAKKKKHKACDVGSTDASPVGALPMFGLGLAFAGIVAARRRHA